ncbi:hypothetical protein [Roseomonas sp. HF4]|uniref:hypothetical protein n=1 Tax=Roseomonas sp. HF4 TaxID=2562313 RepID=UPI001484DFE9|nr:hypothetical protein [Roseomonas sp. HF4]
MSDTTPGGAAETPPPPPPRPDPTRQAFEDRHGLDDTPPPPAAPAPPPSALPRTMLHQAPYIAMLAAAFFGVSYAAFASGPNPTYWKIVTPLFGVLCVVAGWSGAPDRGGRMRLIWTQALHWAGFLLAMLVLFRPEVQAALAGRGAEIGLLMLLALGTFVAGVHAGSWRIGAVGVVLGASVPLLALVQQSFLLILGAAVLVGAAGAVFVMLAARGRG